MKSIGFPELLIILGVAVLLFGGKKIPEQAKGFRNCPQVGRISSRAQRSENENPARNRGVFILARKGPILLFLWRHDRILRRLSHAELDHFFSWNFDSLTRC